MIRGFVRRLRFIVVAALAAMVFVGNLFAQNNAVNGQVFAGSQPVPNQLVSLHRVSDTGGSTVSVDTTDAQGRFVLPLGSDPTNDIHFVAARYEGQLYISDTFRGKPDDQQYRVLVGPGATPINFGNSAGAAAPPAAGPVSPGPDSRGTGLAVIIAATAIMTAIVLMAWRPRVPASRRLLVEIAELDNRHETAPVQRYDEQRAELLRRLRESS